LEEAPSYKYFGTNIHHKKNWNYSVEKGLAEFGKLFLVLKIILEKLSFGFGKKRNFFFDMLVIGLILYGCEVWSCRISRETWRKIEQI
jgi:hypothetical protein